MTAKDKAKELVGLYYEVDGGSIDGGITWGMAKQCALICVDEMLEFDLRFFDIEFLKEVKQEIEKL